MFADFEFYKNSYNGKVFKELYEYNRFGIEASGWIKSAILQNVPSGNNENIVKLLECKIADLIYNLENTASVGKSSESVGAYSVSYTAEKEKEKKEAIYSLIKTYLGSTGLLYSAIRR